MDLEQLIKLSKAVAKPYVIAVGILSILLLISICGNIYMATQGTEVSFQADNNIETLINQEN
jgi:NADH:ubiquinone oxidoreductase subunit 6 (subunit J)